MNEKYFPDFFSVVLEWLSQVVIGLNYFLREIAEE